jgi:SRSO17 transposase
MDGKQLRRLRPELDTFVKRYLPLFGCEENQPHAQRFIHGLLGTQERRNTENLAEAVEGGVVRTMQKFISQGSWEGADVLRELRKHVTESLGDERGTINVDETGFPKKGKKSVGVKRQYSGTLGRVDNCQIGVFANYCSTKGHTFLDRKIYLPEEWCQDFPRRQEAGVPPSIVFRTKPELGLEMIRTACDEQVPFQWVGGDSVYGDNPTFVQGVRELKKWYVLDVSSEAYVWLARPEFGKPGPRGGRAQPKTKPISVAEAAAQLSPSAFRRLAVSEGSQGSIVYEYAEMKVWFSEEGYPAEECERLLVRRSLNQDGDPKYHRSNAPKKIALQRLAEQRACRWTVEEDIKASKGQCGLDEYETRGWTGWHHHTVLSVLALLFLVLQKRRMGKKRATDDSGGSSRGSSSPAGSSRVGRGRNRCVEQLADGTQSRRQAIPRGKKTRGVAAAK